MALWQPWGSIAGLYGIYEQQRSLQRTQATGVDTKWAWRSLCSDGLVHFSRCSNGMLVFHELHGNCGHPPPKKNWFTNLNGWCHKWKLLLISSVPGRTPQAAGSIISLGRWVCPGFWKVSWWGNSGKPWLASTQLFEFDLSLTWLDFFSILFFGGCT